MYRIIAWHTEDHKCGGCHAAEGARCKSWCPRLWAERILTLPRYVREAHKCPVCPLWHRRDASIRGTRCWMTRLVVTPVGVFPYR